MRPATVPIMLSAALLAAAPAGGHHSFAMFDPARILTLEGTIAEFRWVNPHVAIFVKDGGSDDPDKLWSVELTSPSNLRRRGFERTSLKPGDKVIVQLNPLRDGRRGGGFRSVKLVATGQVLGAPLIDIERDGGG
jgi:hypothetical protein